jgi:hypothetical protein
MPVNFVPLIIATTGEAMVIDVPNGSKEPGTGVILFSQNNPRTANQLWELLLTGETAGPGGAPFVFIINQNSGMALTVPLDPRFDAGAAVVQQPLDHADNQKWLQFRPPSVGADNLVFANKWSSMVLAVKGSNFSNGTPIIQEGETDHSNQLWTTSLS